VIRQRADHGPEESSEDRRPDRGAEHLAPSVHGRGRDQPRQRPRPRERAADALHEPGGRECPRIAREPEGEAGGAHEPDADEQGTPGPVARGGDSAGQRGNQSSGGVSADEKARGRLREAELVLVMRQERDER
jgi:hypothetical protein